MPERNLKVIVHVLFLGACGPVDRAFDSRSEDLGFDSQCWPCVEVLGKLCIPHYLGQPSHNGYLVHRAKAALVPTLPHYLLNLNGSHHCERQ